MRVLFVSNLFPDATEPDRGIYNARLIHHLGKLCDIRVAAPRPALPFLGGARRSARPEDAKFIPEFPPTRYIPKIGSPFNHRLMAASLRPELRRIHEEFPFDVALASWLYPDACAISILAREMRFPLVAVCQGSDAHQYLKNPTRRQIIVESLASASAIVTRSGELARLLAATGLPEERLKPIHNGVDLEQFHPIDQAAARESLNLPTHDKIILFVGNFYPVKNPGLLADAYADLAKEKPGKRLRLVMIGDGPERKGVIRRLSGSGLESTTRFPGRLPPETVARYMQAADLLCVPSDNEGVPNVILEAFASGLKVVATDVGGIPEILDQDFLGRLTPRGKGADLVSTLSEELARPADRTRIRDHATRFSWGRTTDAYLEILTSSAKSTSNVSLQPNR